MKATLLDYLFSTLMILALAIAASVPVAVLHSALAASLNPYHILVELAFFMLGYGLMSGLAVRLLLRIRPIATGIYDQDSYTFTYWKLITVTYRLGQGALRPFVPVFLNPMIEAIFGARIGSNVAIGGTIDDPYAVSVGDGSVLGNGSLVSANFIVDGKLVCGSVRIGTNVTIGANSVIYPNTEIGDGATVTVGSVLMPGSKVPAGETWRGNPARKWSGSGNL